ncbi:hypothetical protein AYO20_00271 [Fonsecaea nubica]|uniref:DUF6594 domain-containing protein n=1 Tax=Fonsecaea nubica TaxID=856822 RepID=A0A178DHM0_9EURO|nr:hypothetical protein AYO20_00271 [Fonsecaea nubica]OAL40535.1 hypothetical protein AYO20_00271 [Fonsecaea nubica]
MAPKAKFRSHLSHGSGPRGVVSGDGPRRHRRQATLESIKELDCRVPGPNATQNRTTSFAASQRRIRGGTSEFGTNFAEYSDTAITQAANLLGTVLASLLPVVAIIVLYLIEGMGIRLGLVAIFSALFSTCLWFLNDGKLIEVFSATSA